jgi:hypothetical protein
MSGKGHAPRPFDVPREVYESNHARIFGEPKPKERYVPPALPAAPPRVHLPNQKLPHEAECYLYVGPRGTESIRIKGGEDK